eukprot:431012_1
MSLFIWLICCILAVCTSYILIEGDYTWPDAENMCLTQSGAHLATITSSVDNIAFYTLCPNVGDGCWMGYNKINSAGWQWVDDSTSTYTAWRPGEPSGDGDCVENHQDVDITVWNDRVCNQASCDAICNDEFSVSCETHGYVKHLNWNNLTSSNFDINTFELTTFDINTQDLTINIEITLPYLGYSTANDGQYGFGTTYVIDFAPFDGNQNNIYEAGTCQNRKQQSFYDANSTLKNFAMWWEYSHFPYVNNQLGSDNYLSYPSSDHWSVSSNFADYTDIKTGCDSITYSALFSWFDLFDCTNYNGNTPYLTIESDDTLINMSGTLYVDIVSPYSLNEDIGGYRVYGVISQPFMLSIHKNIFDVAHIGINLFSMTVLSIGYTQNNNKKVSITLLTESSDQLYLHSGQILSYPVNNNTNNYQIDTQTALIPLMSNCLNDQQYICRQKWLLQITDIQCDIINGNDFSGEYSILFNVECNSQNVNDTQCNQYITTYGSTTALSVDVVYSDDDCTINNKNYATLKNTVDIFTDFGFSVNAIDTQYVFDVGQDIVYVELILNENIDVLNLFAIRLQNVWICTYDPEYGDILNPTVDGDGGCLSNDTNIESYHHIYINEQPQVLYNTQLIYSGSNDVRRFSFIVPTDIKRNILYIHTQTIIDLSDNSPRRMLQQNYLNTYSYNGEEINVMLSDEKNDNSNSNEDTSLLMIISMIFGSVIVVLVLLIIVIIYYMKREKNTEPKLENIDAAISINTSAKQSLYIE